MTKIMIKILLAIHYCFYTYMVIIVIRCLLTWIPVIDWNNRIIRLICDTSDVYLDLFRKFIPPLGMVDLSPVVAMIALIFLERICLYAAVFILGLLGVGLS